MGITGTYSESSTYRSTLTNELPAIQIDLIIDRNDHAINLLELKFYNDEFLLSKTYAQELRRKRTVFRTNTKTKKQLFLTMITTFGLIPNEHSIGLMDKALTMDALFTSAPYP